MFIDNKYTRWYHSIINAARQFPQKRGSRGVYVERHHILPECLGGPNTADNLVFLTAREHIVCHALLTKMVHGNVRHKMYHALAMMVKPRNSEQTRLRAFKPSYALGLARSRQGATSGSFSRDAHPFAIRVSINGVMYASVHQAAKALGISGGAVMRQAEHLERVGAYPKPEVSRRSAGTFAVDNHPRAQTVNLDGVTYSSLTQAACATGISRADISKITQAGITIAQFQLLRSRSKKPFRYLKRYGLPEQVMDQQVELHQTRA